MGLAQCSALHLLKLAELGAGDLRRNGQRCILDAATGRPVRRMGSSEHAAASPAVGTAVALIRITPRCNPNVLVFPTNPIEQSAQSAFVCPVFKRRSSVEWRVWPQLDAAEMPEQLRCGWSGGTLCRPGDRGPELHPSRWQLPIGDRGAGKWKWCCPAGIAAQPGSLPFSMSVIRRTSLLPLHVVVCCLLDVARAELSVRFALPIEGGTRHTVSWFSLPTT